MVSYCSRIFAVGKPKGGICLVADIQELNRVTVCDAGLPPRTDDFTESFVSHVIYGLADLFSCYDGQKLAVTSRPLTTFSCLLGPLHSCVLPQGATNSLQYFTVPPPFLQESTGIHQNLQESTGIHQNGTGIHWNPQEWDWNPHK